MTLQTQLLMRARQAAVIGLVLISLFVAFKTTSAAVTAWDSDQPASNSVDKWEKRMQPVRDHLPGDVTLVGYMADWDIPGSGYIPIDQDAEYVLTQYALAPIMVKPGLDQEWIVGNFLSPGFESWLDRSLPSYDIQSFGFGIYLIHRTFP
jgi:hypothetical protein